MIRLLRFIKGYIFFCAEGDFPERFLNLCSSKDINLWNVKNNGVKVEAYTSIGDFKRLSLPAENSGMVLKILKEGGLLFFVKRHKWRCGALLGLLLTVMFWVYMSGFIWEVEVLPVDGVKVEAFTESLSELGVKNGARKSKIDIIEVQNELMVMHPELQWVSLNIFGGKAQLEMTVVKEKEEENDTETPANIVAGKSGTVTLVKTYFGTGVVKEGANVAKGELLISGVGTNADGSEYFVRSQGEVFAETKNEIVKAVKCKNKFKITSESSSHFSFYIFGVKIPFGKKHDGAFESQSETPLKSGKTVLPVAVIRTDNMLLSEKGCELTSKETELSALLKCVEEKRSLFSDVELKAVEFSSEVTSEETTVKADIVCIEDIGVEKTITVENHKAKN